LPIVKGLIFLASKASQYSFPEYERFSFIHDKLPRQVRLTHLWTACWTCVSILLQ